MMPHRSLISHLALVVFVCVIVGEPITVRAQTPVTIPDSPAGTLMKQWLDTFNSADSAALDAFSKAHTPRISAQAHMQVRRRMGGLELVRIISAEPTRIVFAARARATGAGLRGTFELADGDPSQVKTLGLQAIPPGAPLEGCTTYASASPHSLAADVGSEDAIIAARYDAISGPPCQHRDWERFRGLFAPGARLIPTVMTSPDGPLGIRAETPEDYVAAVKNSMEEFGFAEKEISHVGESFNGVVHRFSTYESRRAATDEKPFARGINSIQLLNDGKRWWVVTVYWAGERPGAPIPAAYLNRP